MGSKRPPESGTSPGADPTLADRHRFGGSLHVTAQAVVPRLQEGLVPPGLPPRTAPPGQNPGGGRRRLPALAPRPGRAALARRAEEAHRRRVGPGVPRPLEEAQRPAYLRLL